MATATVHSTPVAGQSSEDVSSALSHATRVSPATVSQKYPFVVVVCFISCFLLFFIHSWTRFSFIFSHLVLKINKNSFIDV